MQSHATEQLHIKMPHLHDAFRALAHHGKGFGQQRIERLALCCAVFKFLGFSPQRLITELLKLRLQCINARYHRAVLLEQAVVTTAENFGEEVCSHAIKTGLRPASGLTDQRSPLSETG